MWAVGSFAVGAADDAGRPVRRDDVRDARRRPRDAPDRARSTVHGSFSPSTASILGVDLPRHDRLGRRLHGVHLAARATRRSGTVSTYAYVNPVVAIILGVLFRDEHLTGRILVGAAIVVASVAVVVRQEPPAATQPEEGVR